MNTITNYYDKYKMDIVIDFDDTISFAKTFNSVSGYAEAKPNIELINTMRKLSAQGYKFIIHTARGWISCNQNVEKAEQKYRKQMETWLEKYNVPYERIIFGKPFGMLYVDDKALRPDEFVEKFR